MTPPDGSSSLTGPEDASILDVVGIDQLGERIYRFVLANGGANAEAVAARFRIAQADAESRLTGLRMHGLIAQRYGTDADYAPVDPRVAIRVLADSHSDRISRILQTVPSLAAEFDTAISGRGDTDQTQLLSDPDAVAGWYVRLQHQAQHEFMAFDRPPYVSASANPLEPVILDRGVTWRAVYAAESFDGEGNWEEAQRLAERGEQARVAPTLPIKLAIADRATALVSLTLDADRTQALVTTSASLIEAFCVLFEYYWASAIPIPSERADAAAVQATVAENGDLVRALVPSRNATREEQVLLTLIGAGLKDDVIARQLGISSRTLRRRSQDLMIELGAANRFQAGVEATKRGWV